MKVCVIGVYFGIYPGYFDLWLKSCEQNPQVDFYVVGDAKIDRNVPNVHHIYMTLFEFKVKAERVLGTTISLEYPFKCCDYKPLYGLILQDLICEYDYWGYCDFDMLFGDILSFLEKYEVEKYDKFLPLGHLAFMRNTPEINQVALERGESIFRNMIASKDTVQFDELGGINQIMSTSGYSMFQKRVFADISRLWRRIKLASRYKDSNDINYQYQLFYWEQGKVYRKYLSGKKIMIEEYIYIHLKKRKYVTTVNNFDKVECIVVTPDRLLVYENPIEVGYAEIKKLNPYKGRVYEFLEEKLLSRNKNHIAPLS